ncbi:hypothetical protein N4P33_19245 [Streptomyces sp. 15-116A]|nr:hypothetical protein [Streptomyces sp. 15-116A]MCT7354270.1 hypothetical protein [Streptomyces sp. 15-116A]
MLWDSGTAEPLKVPRKQVRLLPAKSPGTACGFPARTWERG